MSTDVQEPVEWVGPRKRPVRVERERLSYVITVRMPAELKRRLDARAHAEDVSANTLCNTAITRLLNELERRSPPTTIGDQSIGTQDTSNLPLGDGSDTWETPAG